MEYKNSCGTITPEKITGTAEKSLEIPMGKILLFNKPFGVICQFSRDGVHPTLADYIALPDFYPAGRLDTDSEGLLVLTDDGQLQHRITDPKHKLPKTYWVQVEGVPDEAALEQLRRGVKLSDFTTQPAEARLIDNPAGLWPRNPPIRQRKNIPTSWLELTIREGKNRQVRRMTAAVGLPTLRLIRYRIGEWTLSGLEPGKWQIEVP
jgi:23S rRNA pseudouridine2457 synthase